MPDKITLEDALKARPAKTSGITFDDALASYEASKTPQLVSLAAARAKQGNSPLFPQGEPSDLPPGYSMLPPKDAIAPASDGNFGASLKSKLVEDPNTKRRLIAESLFPNDPNGINRVGVIDGRAVFVNDDGKLEYVSGKAGNFGAAAIANAPEAIGAIAGSFAASPVAGSTLGAIGGRGLKRAFAGAVLDEPQTITGNLKDIATEGALNLAVGSIGKGVVKFSDRGKIIDFTPTDLKAAEQAREYIKRSTGIDVDIAQATGNRKLLGLRDYAARYPGKSAELIQAADDAAAGQFEQATDRVLNLVARAEPSEIAGMRGVNAAQMVIKVARQQVYNEVGPLYRAAYDAVPVVQEREILNYLKLPYFKEAFSAGQKLRSLETGSATQPFVRNSESLMRRNPDGSYQRTERTVDTTSTGATKVKERLTEGRQQDTPEGVLTQRRDQIDTNINRPSLEELDYTKRALDEKIESLMDAGQRSRARALKIKRDEFVQALDRLPNQQWQLARRRYGELIKESVEPLENGAVGVLANIENHYAATSASKILSDANVTPKQILLAKTKITQQDPEAWDGLVRQWLGQKWNVALKETQGGDVINPAGKFRQAIYGTPGDRAKASAMLSPQSAQAFDDLMVAAEALAKTPLGASRVAGSNTARDLELNETLKGTGGVVFRWLTSPRKSIQEAAEQRAKEQNILAITEAITNPAKRSQLRQVAKMQPSTRQAILLMNILGGQITQRAVAGGATQLPSESTPPRQ